MDADQNFLGLLPTGNHSEVSKNLALAQLATLGPLLLHPVRHKQPSAAICFSR